MGITETSVSDFIREKCKKLDSQPGMNPGIFNLLSIKMKYQNNFSKVSNCFEIWAENRRRTIEKLSVEAKHIKTSRQICYKAILTFSSLSVIASTVSLFLNKSCSRKSFLAAATFGSLSFLFSLFDVRVSRTKADEIDLMYHEDKFTLDNLEQEIQFGVLNFDFREFFPFGVNYKIVKYVIKPWLMNRKKLSHFKTLYDEMDLASDNEMIFFVIVLSNILSDPDLLQDTYLLDKAQMFSKSSLAEKWWNRLKYENSSHHSEKMELLSEIKSFSKQEKLCISGLLEAVFVMSNDIFQNAVALAFVNIIVLFNVYNELKIQIEPKESSKLKQLEGVLQAEYEEMKKVYNRLNPFSE